MKKRVNNNTVEYCVTFLNTVANSVKNHSGWRCNAIHPDPKENEEGYFHFRDHFEKYDGKNEIKKNEFSQNNTHTSVENMIIIQGSDAAYNYNAKYFILEPYDFHKYCA